MRVVIFKGHRARGISRRWILFLLLVASGLAAGLAMRHVFSPSERDATPTLADPRSDATVALNTVVVSAEALARGEIHIATVARRPLPQELRATGRVQINEDRAVRIGAPVEGRVTRVLATVGDRVKAGQPVLALHSHELAAARSDYEKARAAVARAEKALAYAQAELERANRLLEAKAISRREQLRAAADVVAAEAELEQARAELRRAEEFLHHLGAWPEPSDEVLIRAPIDGVVLERRATVGMVVTPSMDLLTIADLSTLWVIAEVPEPQAARIRLGQPAFISVAAFAEERFPGHVAHIGEVLDPQTRTVRVRCVVQNRQQRLRPEMYATILIALGTTAPQLAIPREAVQEIGGESVVFVEIAPGRFEKRRVQLGLSAILPDGEFVEVTGGLREGERIVTRGSFWLKSELLKAVIQEEP
ncbi:MAG: efflux RND transporter periplasmic adaptor subunit [Blastocatellia bacterium]|nr:efflux RND transporter periplasmic adaptor subunit [Blastocatellia bacterium]MCS7156757.1 efflux RND transporter periplasmic adaptor subunit [Blastocatellia bacterium]MCX7751501.1 efflux RND transporter periplasmic adaptor subunit [Blastocatellia bacterium]MDW8168601.1 efflux RND transporter periplasmic adaptor subunit [Acidobacteriota bacterium]MDW8256566.1 efflux RND transporter periplasmic adaptor subunit [Acidobacteriota bacterium]